MVEIEFSVMEGVDSDVNSLLPLLEAFEKQYHTHVNLTSITWAKGWGEIAKFGIFGHGPDVSCIGSTWIGSLASMHALRSFNPQQVRALGGEDAFFESSWRAGFLPSDPSPWAIPWLGDVMVIYYWKDALEKAGIKDFEAALATDAAIIETLKKLQKSGYASPLAISTANLHDPVILHQAARWLWSAGGDFINKDANKVVFDEPASLQGLRNYFSLRPFVSPESLSASTNAELFIAGKAAIHFGGPFLGTLGRQRHPEWNQRLGIAPVPGITYAGGSSLVIWQYTRYPAECFELVRFLSSQPTRIPVSPHDQGLPTRRNALDMPSAENDIFHRILLQSMHTSRSFPCIRLWGSIEDKLIIEISKIWAELFADPDQDLDACLHKYIDPLAQRLNILLEN
jgi:ABC-type glycerol-3-phosphate transport system substrate-binding protein